jgi:hypothetical protein
MIFTHFQARIPLLLSRRHKHTRMNRFCKIILRGLGFWATPAAREGPKFQLVSKFRMQIDLAGGFALTLRFTLAIGGGVL